MANLFIKFGKEEHLREMQSDGLFYCNTITYFASIDGDINRSDNFENVFETKYFETPNLEIKVVNDNQDCNKGWKKLGANNLQLRHFYEKPIGNIFCISAFNLNPINPINIFHFDERLIEFGNCALVIMNQPLFLERLNEKLEELIKSGIMHEKGFIKYSDLRAHSGEVSLFQKDNRFAFQEEFRIYLKTDKYEVNDPFKFYIGDISDISEIIDLYRVRSFYYK